MRCTRGAGPAAPLRRTRNVERCATTRSAAPRCRARPRAHNTTCAARAAFSASADGGSPAQPQLAAQGPDTSAAADATSAPSDEWRAPTCGPAALAPELTRLRVVRLAAVKSESAPMLPRLFSRAEPVTLETLQQCFPQVKMDKFQVRTRRRRRASSPADAGARHRNALCRLCLPKSRSWSARPRAAAKRWWQRRRWWPRSLRASARTTPRP